MDKIEERAKEMQREYLREWRRKNPDKVRKYHSNYWLRKAEMMQKGGAADDTISDHK